jgi:(p)ppGpp synthase/HD superfamily hydrolase
VDPPFTFLQELPRARDAWAYAERLHGEQRRESDEAPFILHPLEVASLLRNTGHSEAAVTAGILHDTVEDTEASTDDIRARFGDDVAALVAAMTEDATIESYEDRKAALRRQVAEFGQEATAVYAADKVAKVRELRARATGDASVLEREHRRLDHYHRSLAMLEHADPEHPLVRQLRFELEALQALPPHAA